MTTIKMDRELVRVVRDAIAADVEKFEMASWFSGRWCYTDVPAAKRLDGCGTTGCLAGHAVVEYAKLHNTAWRVYSDFVKWPLSGRSEAVANVARRLLSGGLDTQSNEAWMALFSTTGWPQHYRDTVVAGANSHEAQAKAAIDLLDDILDGITVCKTVMAPRCFVPGCNCGGLLPPQWVYLPDEAGTQ